MIEKISKNDLFDSISIVKGVGPKTLTLIEKLCGNRVIDLLLTVPKKFKKENI